MNGRWLVYCESMNRQSPKIVSLDIKNAIAWYAERTGDQPKVICLNPKIAGKVNVPDNIQVITKGGCLAFEVWLMAEEPAPQKGIVCQGNVEKPSQGVLAI